MFSRSLYIFACGVVSTIVIGVNIVLHFWGEQIFPNSKIPSMLIFMFSVEGLVFVTMPMIANYAEKWLRNGGWEFLDVPSRDCKFKFPALSSFLGEQAFASLLATIMTFIFKFVLAEFNSFILTFIFYVSCIMAVSYMGISYIRFLFYFKNSNGIILAMIVASSLLFGFGLFGFGIYIGTISI
ncbi:hypothetical protein [Vibrio cholerae]|uniref:hypothetical protein n=1 Tax=Vibrio cholerae TaxID=666 RepID=UPI000E6A4BEE|nr:hypothetical protein [Vibrio cholerae]EJL6375329.1 hypothetical protein [Vibrio cholerae]ELJ8501957.1 hypothetical protein [Vibrio cholerae]EMC9265744.1 hypothetical protein [Vibrio cholerae]EMC9387951.1 hypothetical protein [Vibrio cholerae]MBJ6969668.1 hypothetical protein [Vibrio cholerae]